MLQRKWEFLHCTYIEIIAKARRISQLFKYRISEGCVQSGQQAEVIVAWITEGNLQSGRIMYKLLLVILNGLNFLLNENKTEE